MVVRCGRFCVYIPIAMTSSARSMSTSHSFWKRFVSLMSASTRSTVSPISVISATIFRCESKLVYIWEENRNKVGPLMNEERGSLFVFIENPKLTCNSRKSCSKRLKSKHCFNRIKCVFQKSSNRRSVSSNCTKSLR